jgi:hypothetical protein
MAEQNEETMIAGESAHCDCPERTKTQNANLRPIYETRGRSLPHGCGPCRRVYEGWFDGVYPRHGGEDYQTFMEDQFADPGDGPEERLERGGEDDDLARYPEDYVD